jgi:NAD(P)-dependent dehydrogenase (short-subunit alcohol dehydrogenase family)
MQPDWRPGQRNCGRLTKSTPPLSLPIFLNPRGVHVLAVCPGPVVTSFFERIVSKPPPQAISAERVILETLQAFGKKQAVKTVNSSTGLDKGQDIASKDGKQESDLEGHTIRGSAK